MTGRKDKGVKTHRARIMHKLKIRGVAGLVLYAIQRGLISTESRSS